MAEQLPSSYYKTPFKFSGKEMDEETGLHYFGARYYDSRISIWMSVDPLAEKYPNIGPYVYVANNPINAIDPDGREIVFLIRNKKGVLIDRLNYRNGNFWHYNGKRYNPAKESLSPTLYKVLSTYRKIEKSNNKRLKSVLRKLETSKLIHFVEKGATKNYVEPFGIPTESAEGSPIGTRTFYNFSKEDDIEYEKTEGVSDDDDATIVHEMRHQFDYDIGNHKDNSPYNDEKDPMEIRAVFHENLMRSLKNQPVRKRYGRPIDPEKLKNPPNNKPYNKSYNKS